MGKIYTSVEQLVGRTPLMELTHIEKQEELRAKILVKPEAFNPAGSAKDRVAKSMIEEAEKSGTLKQGATIIEPTSGNTGIGLAAIGAAKGYRVIITMPETMSVERQKLIRAYGAEIVLTDGAKEFREPLMRQKKLAAKIPGSFIPGQFVNPANPKAHYETTGPEIWEDTDGRADIFVAGVGTGGTITGTGKYLKEQNPKIRIVAVEPASSAFLSTGAAGNHKIQGIGAGFVPEVLDLKICDEIIAVSDEAAYELARRIGRTEGILIGISGGAAVWAAVELARRPENEGKTIVALLPDSGERYLSTDLFDE